MQKKSQNTFMCSLKAAEWIKVRGVKGMLATATEK